MSTPPEELPELSVNTYDRDVMPVRDQVDNELPQEPEADKAKAEQPTKRTAHRK